MQKISEEFGKNGYKHQLISRRKHYCIYAVSNINHTLGYEVHIIREKPECQLKLKDYTGKENIIKFPKREVLASNNEFGKYGWSYEKLINAELKIQELMKGVKK